MANTTVCTDTSEAVDLYEPQKLFLKPVAKINICVQLPQLKAVGKTISNWEVMEKLKHMIRPESFLTLKIFKSTKEFIRLEGEIENKGKIHNLILKLDGKTIKLSGFTDILKVRAAEAKVNFPSRHDWDSYFRDAKNMNEMRPGERPDTVYIKDLPTRWFSASHSDRDGESSLKPSESVVKKVFQIFGDIRCIDIPMLDQYRKEINASLKKSNIQTFSYGQDLTFECYIQYMDYISFVKAMDSMRGMKLLFKGEDRALTAIIKVDFDKTKHLSEKNIRRRRIERGKLEALEQERLERARREKDEEERKREDERRRKEEEERERERRRQEKLTRKEERRKEREEKRRQKKMEKKQKEEEERMQYKIALEERKLVIAQRKLESLRIISELFERIKAIRIKKYREEKEREIEDQRKKQVEEEHKKKLEEEMKKMEEKKLKKQKLQEQEQELRSKILKNFKAKEERQQEIQREKLRQKLSGTGKVKSAVIMKKAVDRARQRRNRDSEDSDSNNTDMSSDSDMEEFFDREKERGPKDTTTKRIILRKPLPSKMGKASSKLQASQRHSTSPISSEEDYDGEGIEDSLVDHRSGASSSVMERVLKANKMRAWQEPGESTADSPSGSKQALRGRGVRERGALRVLVRGKGRGKISRTVEAGPVERPMRQGREFGQERRRQGKERSWSGSPPSRRRSVSPPRRRSLSGERDGRDRRRDNHGREPWRAGSNEERPWSGEERRRSRSNSRGRQRSRGDSRGRRQSRSDSRGRLQSRSDSRGRRRSRSHSRDRDMRRMRPPMPPPMMPGPGGMMMPMPPHPMMMPHPPFAMGFPPPFPMRGRGGPPPMRGMRGGRPRMGMPPHPGFRGGFHVFNKSYLSKYNHFMGFNNQIRDVSGRFAQPLQVGMPPGMYPGRREKKRKRHRRRRSHSRESRSGSSRSRSRSSSRRRRRRRSRSRSSRSRSRHSSHSRDSRSRSNSRSRGRSYSRSRSYSSRERSDRSGSRHRSDRSGSRHRSDRSGSRHRSDRSGSRHRSDRSGSRHRSDRSESRHRSDRSESRHRSDRSESRSEGRGGDRSHRSRGRDRSSSPGDRGRERDRRKRSRSVSERRKDVSSREVDNRIENRKDRSRRSDSERQGRRDTKTEGRKGRGEDGSRERQEEESQKDTVSASSGAGSAGSRRRGKDISRERGQSRSSSEGGDGEEDESISDDDQRRGWEKEKSQPERVGRERAERSGRRDMSKDWERHGRQKPASSDGGYKKKDGRAEPSQGRSGAKRELATDGERKDVKKSRVESEHTSEVDKGKQKVSAKLQLKSKKDEEEHVELEKKLTENDDSNENSE